MPIKPFKDLSLVDDFMFSEVMLRDICHFSRDGLVKKGVHKDAFPFIV